MAAERGGERQRGGGVMWGLWGGASPQAASSAHITLPNCHCPHRAPPLRPCPDRMINGGSAHASATVPVYAKHYHNFFFLLVFLR